MSDDSSQAATLRIYEENFRAALALTQDALAAANRVNAKREADLAAIMDDARVTRIARDTAIEQRNAARVCLFPEAAAQLAFPLIAAVDLGLVVCQFLGKGIVPGLMLRGREEAFGKVRVCGSQMVV